MGKESLPLKTHPISYVLRVMRFPVSLNETLISLHILVRRRRYNTSNQRAETSLHSVPQHHLLLGRNDSLGSRLRQSRSETVILRWENRGARVHHGFFGRNLRFVKIVKLHNT